MYMYRFHVCMHSFHNLLAFFFLGCAIDTMYMFTFTKIDILKVSNGFLHTSDSSV